MFQITVKGRDLKNLITLHNKHLAAIPQLHAKAEQERDAEAQQEAEQMAQIPQHLRLGAYQPMPSVGLLRQTPSQRELAACGVIYAIEKNRWLLEQIKDDESYTLERQDFAILGLTGLINVHGINPYIGPLG